MPTRSIAPARVNPPAPAENSKQRRNSGVAMIGLVPKTSLCLRLRNPPRGTKFPDKSANIMKKEINHIRMEMLYHFERGGKMLRLSPSDESANTRPITRSTVKPEEDWIVDLDAADCRVTDTQRLSRYVLERISTLPLNTPLLLLVRVSEDAKYFSDKSSKSENIQSKQQLPRRTISGK